MRYSAVMAAHLLEWRIVTRDVVRNDETVVATHGDETIIRRVLDALDSLALTISTLPQNVEL